MDNKIEKIEKPERIEKEGTVIIFGGSDPESEAARRILEREGWITATATVEGKDGEVDKVHNGNAYRANGFSLDNKNVEEDTIKRAVLFECSENAVPEGIEIADRCDHHREGDRGHNVGPEFYWEASSIGQLCQMIGVKRTPELELIAAGDHCPADAYAGACEGVNPEDFLGSRIDAKVEYEQTINRKKGIEVSDDEAREKISEDIKKAVEILNDAPDFSENIKDLRGFGMISQLPEAALMNQKAYISEFDDVDFKTKEKTGNKKVVIGGKTSPEDVMAFLEWAKNVNGLVGEPYGDPKRGFAGFIVKKS